MGGFEEADLFWSYYLIRFLKIQLDGYMIDRKLKNNNVLKNLISL